MYLRRLRLAQFRNHSATDITVGPEIGVFVGANAQGKSALLEAIYLSATARSFRTQHEGEMIALGEEWARVRSVVQRAGREEEIDVTLRREAGGHGPAAVARTVQEIRVNGTALRRSELFGHLRCVTAAPEDAAVVTGPPRLRRRLLDLLLAQVSPTYYDNARRYQRIILQRNRVLRRRMAGGLAPWDEQLVAVGAAITMRRRGAAARLSEHVGPIYHALSGGREALRVDYVPSLPGDTGGEIEAHAWAQIPGRRAAELARGTTLLGPHRDDLRLSLDGHDLHGYGSRGQHLSAMLAVRLAERRVLREETGEDPVLLLDDVTHTLDENRRAYLLDAIRGSQALFTATALVRELNREGVAVFRVEAGRVAPLHAHIP